MTTSEIKGLRTTVENLRAKNKALEGQLALQATVVRELQAQLSCAQALNKVLQGKLSK